MCHAKVYYEENIEVLEKLLSSCCSLQHLNIEGLCITAKVALSISNNGKTLQVLNLNHSFVHGTLSIIKCCQELKELHLNFINENEGLCNDDLKVLVNNTYSTKVEKFNLRRPEYFTIIP